MKTTYDYGIFACFVFAQCFATIRFLYKVTVDVPECSFRHIFTLKLIKQHTQLKTSEINCGIKSCRLSSTFETRKA